MPTSLLSAHHPQIPQVPGADLTDSRISLPRRPRRRARRSGARCARIRVPVSWSSAATRYPIPRRSRRSGVWISSRTTRTRSASPRCSRPRRRPRRCSASSRCARVPRPRKCARTSSFRPGATSGARSASSRRRAAPCVRETRTSSWPRRGGGGGGAAAAAERKDPGRGPAAHHAAVGARRGRGRRAGGLPDLLARPALDELGPLAVGGRRDPLHARERGHRQLVLRRGGGRGGREREHGRVPGDAVSWTLAGLSGHSRARFRRSSSREAAENAKKGNVL
jgi:hypothetical protein